MGWYQIGT